MKKKYLAFFMICVFILGQAPYKIYANLQSPVSNLLIIHTTGVEDAHGITLSWDEPVESSQPDNAHLPPGNANIHKQERYEIYYRNYTRGDQYPASPHKYDVPFDARDFKDTYTLYPSSLYFFKVEPMHQGTSAPNGDGDGGHQVRVYDPVTQTYGLENRWANKTGDKIPEAIYVTELELEAVGSTDGVTVTWDNLTYGGQDVFKDYTLYYKKEDDDDSLRQHVIPSDRIEKIDGNKLKYVFTNSGMLPGVNYLIKIEPNLPASNKVILDGISYSIAKTKVESWSNANLAPTLYPPQQISSDQIKLIWDSLENYGDIKSVVIQAAPHGTDAFETIGTIYGSQAKILNHWTTEKPEEPMDYRILVDGIPSNIVSYDPRYEDFSPYKPTILGEITPTEASPYSVALQWLAFLRESYNDSEIGDPRFQNKYVDKDVTYEIWITDDADNFNDHLFEPYSVTTVNGNSLRVEAYPNDLDPYAQPSYIMNLSKYVGKNTNGEYTEKAFEANKVYYFKIVATRDTTEQVSNPAYGSCYIPADDDVSEIPSMLSAPPLTIKKDGEGVDMIDNESITVEWDTKWIEVYNPDTNRWYSHISVKDGKIIYGNTDGKNLLDGIAAEDGYTDHVKNALIGNGVPEDEAALTACRIIDISKAEYKMHVAEYDRMLMGYGSYEEYVDYLVDPDVWDSATWNSINPLDDGGKPYFKVTRSDNEAGGLKENTPYVIFLRPYTKKAAYYPAYVTATTTEVRKPLPIEPTSPVLEVVSEKTTDTSITVRFKYSADVNYNLYISEFLNNYPAGGRSIDWETLKESGYIEPYKNPVTGRTEDYYYYTVHELFPETTYYLWLGAFTAAFPEIKYSNPVSETTLELAPPPPPDGFGLASANSLDIYNKENNTDYTKTGKDYIIYEWTRVPGDTAAPPAPYSNNSVDALTSALISKYYTVKFNELITNKEYFARVKTIKTLRRDGLSGTVSYSYLIQVSPDANFTDIMEFVIPPLDGEADGVNILRKESDWTTTLRFVTNPSKDEYNSDKKDNHYPLPFDDYEVLYDSASKTLTYRIRSNQRDSQGNWDNYVDQRFISSLVSKGTFVYDIDLSSYGTSQVLNREVIMPYSVFKAFDERQIGLQLLAKNMDVTINPGTFSTSEINGLSDFGQDSYVKIKLSEGPAVPGLPAADYYSSTPQKIALSVVTPTRTVDLTRTGKDLDISLLLDHRYTVMDTNVDSYFADANSGGWVRTPSTYDSYYGRIKTRSNNLGSFSAIAKSLPQLYGDTDTKTANSIYNVTTKMNLEDITTLNPNDQIHARQFNNLVAALSKGSLSAKVNDIMSSADHEALGRSGLLATDEMVIRETGIPILVSLYEKQTGGKITGYDTGGSFPVEPRYNTAFLKADYLGMLDGYQNAGFKDNMTFGEVFYIIDIIIADAGLYR